jgi:hypothetical protein
MSFRQHEIIILLGAGVSVDAGIPFSSQMINDIENFIENKNDWKNYKDLYYLIKSGVQYSHGLKGNKINFNIEVLLNVLNELEKKETHPLYPFIGSWNVKFNEIVRDNFEIITEFKKKIFEQLKKWLSPKDLNKSKYLSKFIDFKKEFKFSLKIFTLNYDTLLEYNISNMNLKVETGFNEEKRWDYKRFSEYAEEPDFFLYKLHGSIDWERDENTGIVTCIDGIADTPDLIFGTQYKMQYIDPYLFLISEFRYYCMRARLIITLGYSFSDEHINGIISQALSMNNKIIFALAYKEERDEIKRKLSLKDDDRIIVESNKTAKEFLEKEFTLEYLNKYTPEENDELL